MTRRKSTTQPIATDTDGEPAPVERAKLVSARAHELAIVAAALRLERRVDELIAAGHGLAGLAQAINVIGKLRAQAAELALRREQVARVEKLRRTVEAMHAHDEGRYPPLRRRKPGAP